MATISDIIRSGSLTKSTFPIEEPLLTKSPNRFILYPIRDRELWHEYKKALGSFWVPEEIDMIKDVIDWKTNLDSNERKALSYILAFFAVADGIVSENLASRFFQEVESPEARCFYGYQIMIENIHAEAYASFIDALIETPDERDRLFNATSTIKCVTDKTDWALKWSEDKTTPFSMRLAAFAVVEGIFFSSSFALIFWFKSRGLMPGLSFANELISRDEGLHQGFACKLFNRIVNKPHRQAINEMVQEAVNIEKSFMQAAIPNCLNGMNLQLMAQYIEFVADRLLQMLGFPKLYKTSNPFAFMELISLEGKANFFERQVSSYRTAGISIE